MGHAGLAGDSSCAGVTGVPLPPKCILFISAGLSLIAVIFSGSGIFFMIWQVFKGSQCLIDKQDCKYIDGYQRDEVDVKRK